MASINVSPLIKNFATRDESAICVIKLLEHTVRGLQAARNDPPVRVMESPACGTDL